MYSNRQTDLEHFKKLHENAILADENQTIKFAWPNLSWPENERIQNLSTLLV